MYYLSVVIPAYNEEKRIGETLSKVHDYLSKKSYKYEVIVVDDGSSDNTLSIVQKSALAAENKIKILKNDANKGKGFSVKKGILEAEGEYVLLCDADLSVPIEEVEKLFGAISEGYDAAIASRSLKDSDVNVRQPWYRERMGKIFNFFVKILLFKDFNDTQCGFKLLSSEIAGKIALLLKIEGFCYDVEMIYLMKIYGKRIKEVGITWNNSPQSKVKILGSSTRMFLDLFRIKRLHKWNKKGQ